MPITKWDKVYLGVLIVSITVILSIYLARGDTTAQQVAQEFLVPVISVVLLVGVGLQRVTRSTQGELSQIPEKD